jgi:flagellar biosynthesis GTPase FlhF
MSVPTSREKANRTEVEQSHLGKKVAGTALAIGATAASLLPLLSTHIPVDLAVKGLSKLSPRLGGFFTGIFGAGYSANEGLDYLRQQVDPDDEEAKGLKDLLAQTAKFQEEVNEHPAKLHAHYENMLQEEKKKGEIEKAKKQQEAQEKQQKIVQQAQERAAQYEQKQQMQRMQQQNQQFEQQYNDRRMQRQQGNQPQQQSTPGADRLANALERLASVRGK